MEEKQVIELFEQAGAYLEDDHFVYTSGLHGSAYLNKDLLMSDPVKLLPLAQKLARKFSELTVETVVVPKGGAIALGQWVAYNLGILTNKVVRNIFAEKHAIRDYFEFRRGFDNFVTGRRVLILEDIINTGKTVKQLIELVQKKEGVIVGVGSIWNRGNLLIVNEMDSFSYHSLVNKPLQTTQANECLLCIQGVPINYQIGHGRNAMSAMTW